MIEDDSVPEDEFDSLLDDDEEDERESEIGRCPNVDIVVIDMHETRIAFAIDDWNMTTLLACISEDPSDWPEVVAVWARYQTGPSADDIDALGFDVVDVDNAMNGLSDDRAWMVIDLKNKRVCIGKENDPVQRDGCYAWGEDNGFGPEIRVPVHLPPWWELNVHVDLAMVLQPRRSAIPICNPQRDVVWGPELCKWLANRLLESYLADERLREILKSLAMDFLAHQGGSISEEDFSKTSDRYQALRNELYPRKIEIHRDWLMTPRDDLGGRMPRQCLHGSIDWIERVIDGQRWQISRKVPPVPIPNSMADRPDVPMGLSEVCMYFDLCRELIQSGWIWFVAHSDQVGLGQEVVLLALHLEEVQKSWMQMPHEGGSSPSAIIYAERHRSPRVVGEDGENHILDCNCPICEMMANGSFGPTFVSLDGHHLELDDEFAFSTCQTHEEWEEKQREFKEMCASIDAKKIAQSEAGGEEQDEFASVWKRSHISDQGIPGDTTGHLSISFFLADMIGTLEQKGSSQEIIDSLNQAFRLYRAAGHYELANATDQFQQSLEQVARQHTELVGRSADLQHRLDELLRRRTTTETENDPY